MSITLNKILERCQVSVAKVTVKSALNPALWLSATATPVCLILAIFFKDKETIMVILVMVGLAPVILAIVAYLFFMIFDRDRLHSESFQLKKLEMVASREKGLIPGGEDLPSIGPLPLEIDRIDKEA